MPIKVVILAAGKGTRMHSDVPKVLSKVAGKPMLHHLLDNCQKVSELPPIVICGYQSDFLKQSTDPLFKVIWKYQDQQLGTAHAVGLAVDEVDDDDIVLVAVGDVPLTKPSTFERLIAATGPKTMALVTQNLKDPSGLGRIKRDQNGKIAAIVEHKDASADELEISEVNTGIMAIPGAFLKKALPEIKNDNAQKEYYLTDIIELAKDFGVGVEAVQPGNDYEVKGVNSRKQLADLEREFQFYLAQMFMAEQGLTLVDPERVDFRGDCEFEKDVEVDINVIFEGENRIGARCKIGANCFLKNVVLDEDVVIEPMSHLEDVIVRKGAVIGPYARLRPGTDIGENAKVGNFVETKKARLGKNSKANHLSYLGDAEIGENVNVGAGTITCNYDGVNKHTTVIEDGAFIGSNTSLVAPVTIGKDSNVGAGSTISKDTPSGKLSLARAKQLVVENWNRPKKK